MDISLFFVNQHIFYTVLVTHLSLFKTADKIHVSLESLYIRNLIAASRTFVVDPLSHCPKEGQVGVLLCKSGNWEQSYYSPNLIDSNICLDNASAKGYDVTSLDALTTNADAALDDAIANFAEADAALDYAIAAQDAELDREYAEDTLCALHEETSTFSIEETTWITEHDQFYDQSTNDVVSGAIEDKYVHVSHRITTWGASVPGSAPRSSSIAAFTPSWMEDGDHASTASTAGSPTLTYETDHSDTGSLPSLVGSEVSESSYSSVESSASMTAPAIIEPGPSDDMSTPSLENIAADNHWPGAIEIENSDQIESDYTYAQQVYAYQIVENAVELEQIATDHVYATAILDDANVDSATTVW